MVLASDAGVTPLRNSGRRWPMGEDESKFVPELPMAHGERARVGRRPIFGRGLPRVGRRATASEQAGGRREPDLFTHSLFAGVHRL